MKEYYERIHIIFENLPKELENRGLITRSFKNHTKIDIRNEAFDQVLDYLFHDLDVTIYYAGKLKSRSFVKVELPITQTINLVNKKQSYKSIW